MIKLTDIQKAVKNDEETEFLIRLILIMLFLCGVTIAAIYFTLR